MDEIMTAFKSTMRYQLATFKEPDGGVPSDPKETQRQRVLSADPKQFRDRTKSKEKKQTAAPSRKKKTDGYTLQVQKSVDKPTAPSALNKESQKSTPTVQKIKRQAPTPPKGVKATAPSKPPTTKTKTTNDNPFLDDDGEDENTGNPFLEDDGSKETESGNPFLDDDGSKETESGNPFLDDDGSKENESANPFLDDDEEEETGTNPFL